MIKTETTSLISPDKSSTRWLMLVLLWFLYFSFGMTIGSIAPLVSPILADLNMTSGQMGLVHGSWHFVYVFIAPPMGVLVDRFGIYKSLGLGISVILLSLVVRGLAVDFVTLTLAVGAFGFGGPIISVGAPKLVSVWFSGRERGLAIGIYATAPGAGTAFALATANSLVVPLTGSWRGISLVYGVFVAVVAVAWWVLARDHDSMPEQIHSPLALEDTSSRSVFTSLFRLRNVRLIMIVAMGYFFVSSGLMSWVPSLLEEKGMTLTQAGWWTAAATVFSTLGILVIPGLVKHGYRGYAGMGLLIIGTIAVVGLVYLNGPPLIFSLISLNLFTQPILPLTMLMLMETPGVGAVRMGMAAGLFFSAAEVGGFTGPLIMGLLRDATDSLGSGILMLAAIFAILIPVMPFIRESHPQRRPPSSDGF